MKKLLLLSLLLLTSCLTTGVTVERVDEGAVFTLPEGSYLVSSASPIASFSPDVCVFNTLANGSQLLQLTCEVETLTRLFVETNDFICVAPKGQLLAQDTCIDLLE